MYTTEAYKIMNAIHIMQAAFIGRIQDQSHIASKYKSWASIVHMKLVTRGLKYLLSEDKTVPQ